MVGKRRAPVAVVDEEETFVRGGGDGLSAVAHKQIKKDAYAEAEADLLAAGGDVQKKKKRRAAAADGDAEDAFFAGLSLQGRVPKFAELLKFRTLSVGTRVWGAVTEVGARELVVGLPHGLRGHVAYAEASDVLAGAEPPAPTRAGARAAPAAPDAPPALDDLFHVGQLVRCVVVGLRDKEAGAGAGAGAKAAAGGRRRRVDLSLHVAKVAAGVPAAALAPGAAAPAVVTAVEDHGCVLSFGVAGAPAGFLPRADAEGGPGAPPPRRGALVEVVVAAAGDARRPARVTAARAAAAAAAVREHDGLTLGALLPGALVAARVRAALADGLLVSFLTFFSGTVDVFHLGADGGGADWRARLAPGARLKARVLWVDPESKRVGLSAARHLVELGPPPPAPPPGAVLDGARVLRVDAGLGALLALPGGGAGYVHVSNVAEGRVDDLPARLRPGQLVRCRVVGHRPVDGLAAVSLRPGAVDAAGVAGAADCAPGRAVAGEVASVEDWGLLVRLAPGVRAAVPALHASDLGTKKALRKFKAGARVEGRVLAVDAAAKRVTLTLKPALVGSRLPPIVDAAAAAAAGARGHGVVTGVAEFGVFVSFFGGVSGLAPAAECGLPEGQAPPDAYAVGQVVKARVVGSDPGKGLRLSLASKRAKAAAAAEGAAAGAAAGDVVDAVVTAVHGAPDGDGGGGGAAWFEVDLLPRGAAAGNGASLGAGRLEAAHLSDHPAGAAALAAALRPGARLGPLLVLRRAAGGALLHVSRKASLLAAAAAGELPAAAADAREGAVLPGYVASVTPDAVFVHFLNGVAGRAGLAALADTFVSDPALHFSRGQSVRALVVAADAAAGRLSLSLKPSACASGGAAPLAALFADAREARRLEAAAGGEPGAAAGADWAAALPPGAVAAARVHGAKPYGTLLDLDAHPDVVGLVPPHHHAGGAPPKKGLAVGAAVRAAVLDVAPADGVVELSLRPDLVARAEAAAAAAAAAAAPPPKRRGRAAAAAASAARQNAPVEIGDELDCVVELVKPDERYCVVSLPAGRCPPLGAAATADVNELGASAAAAAAPPEVGSTLRCVVAALPSDATGGRLLLQAAAAAAAPRPRRAAADGADGVAPAARKPAPPAGTAVTATVDAVHALHADLTLAGGAWRGRLHAAEVEDAPAGGAAGASPLAALAPGAEVRAVVLGRADGAGARRHGLLELSTRASALAAASAAPPPGWRAPGQAAWDTLRPGQQLRGFVQEATPEHVWVALSPAVRGRALACQAGDSPSACAAAARLPPGVPVAATVLAVDAKRRALDLSLNGSPAEPAPGALALGRVVAATGAGVLVQLGPRCTGLASLADVHDAPVANALAGLAAGQFVRARVLGEAAEAAPAPAPAAAGRAPARRLALSLRRADGGECAAHAAATPPEPPTPGPAGGAGEPAPAPPAGAAELKPGQRVGGYVKSVGSAGAFVVLSRGLVARVRLKHLADGFVDDPAARFPEGARVEGRVLEAAPGGRVELSLRARAAGGAALAGLAPGALVRGRVRRVERFGVFVELDGGGATGLAHVSELADGYVRDVGELFSPGQPVAARVLAVDVAAARLSLGLKPSYLAGEDALEPPAAGSDPDDDFEADLEGGSDGGGGGGGGGDEDEEMGGGSDGDGGGGSFDLDDELAEADSSSDDDDDDDD